MFTHGAPRSSKNSFRNARAFQDRIGIWKCWFLRRGENRSTRRKTSRSRVENQQQTQPTYDAGSGNRTRDTLVGGERSHHYTNPAPRLMCSTGSMALRKKKVYSRFCVGTMMKARKTAQEQIAAAHKSVAALKKNLESLMAKRRRLEAKVIFFFLIERFLCIEP